MASRARPRLVDLADRLKVAPSTVSRALAGSNSVSDATRERVRAVAREMGYTVNPVASGLKRGQTSSIGLVAVMSYWYSGAVTSGADRVAADEGYDFVVMNAAGGRDPELLLHRARRLGQRVDGALVVDIAEGALLADVIEALAVPVVTIGCEAPAVPAVVVDNDQIGALAARHLRDLGHAEAVVLTPENASPLGIDNVAIRASGFMSTFGANVRCAEIPVAGVADRRHAILNAVGTASGVFCATDALAIEAIAAMRDGGRNVPEHASVVGVDDHPLAEAIGLTTIAQEPEMMGEIATSMIVHAVRSGLGSVQSVNHPVRLIERATVKRRPAVGLA